MSDVERVDMGSQAVGSSSSKRDMGSYTSTDETFGCESPHRKYKKFLWITPVATGLTSNGLTGLEPKIVATGIRKALLLPKRKAREGQGVPNGLVDAVLRVSSKRVNPLQSISGVLGNRECNFDDDVDEERLICGGRIGMLVILRNELLLKTEPIPLLQPVPDNGMSIPEMGLLMPDPFERVCDVFAGVDDSMGPKSSLPPSLFCSILGITAESGAVTTPEGVYATQLNSNTLQPTLPVDCVIGWSTIFLWGSREMNLWDTNIVLDSRLGSSLAWYVWHRPRPLSV
ncbi:hypothetical protein Tco_0484977 [Tanacetum coccineum]